MGRQIRIRNLKEIYEPSEQLAGRVGGVRIKTKSTDLALLSVYLPPPIGPRHATSVWRRTVDMAASCLDETLSRIPAKTSIVIGIDMNSDVGYSCENGRAGDETVVGKESLGQQTEAGDAMVEVAHRHHLRFINAVLAPAHSTYYGGTGQSSKIDFMLVDEGLSKTVDACGVGMEHGRALQIINDTRPRDHMPIVMSFRYRLRYFDGTNDERGGDRWDYDALADALQQGSAGKEVFTKRLSDEIEKVDWDPLWSRKTLDAAWHSLRGCLISATRAAFLSQATEQGTIDEYRREIRLVADRKRAIRLGRQEGDLDEVAAQLNDLRRRGRQLGRRYARRRRRVLVSDLQEAWRMRRLSACYRLAWLLSKQRLGPKRRASYQRPRFVPTVQEASTFLQASAQQGGQAAVGIDFAVEEKWEEMAEPLKEMDAQSMEWGRLDFEGVIRAMKRSTKRKAAPEWSVPLEAHIMAMCSD